MRSRLFLASTAVVLFCVGVSRAQLVQTDFSVDPRTEGWTYSDWNLNNYATGGWSSGVVTATTAADKTNWTNYARFWVSPEFAVNPYDYIKITVTSLGRATVSAVGYSSSTTWGRMQLGAAYVANYDGTLAADDWTSFPNTATWTTNVYYSRVLANATTAAVRISGGQTIGGVTTAAQVTDVSVVSATRNEVRQWHDSVYASIPQVSFTPADSRFDQLQRTRAKLLARDNVTIVMLGDSIVNDTSNSDFEVLLAHAYGYDDTTKIKVVTAVGSSAGMNKWNAENWNANASYNWPNNDLDLQAAVIDQQPDLVMIGGISNGTAYADVQSVIEKVAGGVQTKFGYQTDMLLMTGAFGTGNDAAGYADQFRAIASAEDIAFLDMRTIWRNYMGDANAQGLNWDYFYRDWNYSTKTGIHANLYGKEILGRALEMVLTPEPGMLALLGAGAASLMSRRRRR